MSENRAIIDYNTIKENLEMERLQHEIEVKALEEKLKAATKALGDIQDYGEYSNHNDTTKIWRISTEALELITKEE